VLGQNIALAFYCDNTVTLTTCPGNTATNNGGTPALTYFFANGQPGFRNVCDDDLTRSMTGDARLAGCRDVGVVLWTDPDHAEGINSGGTSWAINGGGGGGPDRVRVARTLNFRIYCDHGTPGNINTPCGSPPQSIVGSGANSRAYGRFISLTGGGGGTTLPPSLNGNIVNFES
jgi:hypothetical protein